MRLSLWILGVVAALAAPVAAAPVDEKEHDLASVVAAAAENHPRVRGAQAEVDRAAGGVREARAAALPTVGAALGYTRLEKDPGFQVSPLGSMVFGEADNTTASVTVQYPLYTGGRVKAAKQQAQAGLDATLAGEERAVHQAALAAAERYFDVLRAGRAIVIVEDQVKALEAQRDAVQKMVAAGVVAKIDYLRTEVAVAAAREQLVKARSGRALAVAALAEAMGLPATMPLRVKDNFDEPQLPESLDAAVAEALKARPELDEVDAGAAAAKAAIEMARAARRPQAGAFFQTDFDRPTYMPKTGTWSAGISLTYNLFDGNAGIARVEQARAAEERMDAARAEAENGIRLQVTQRYLEVESARERIATTEKAVAAAEESVRLATVGYKSQVTPLTDVLQAQAERTKARSDLLLAQFDLRAAQSRLLTAIGRPQVPGSQPGSGR